MIAGAFVLSLSLLAGAVAHVEPPGAAAEPAAPAVTEEKPSGPARPAPALPSLDDLLGTDPGAPAGDEPATEDTTTDAELDRRLSAKELGDAFEQAITLMGDAAARLKDRKDAGLNTQRVQEDALRKLDELIAQLEKQQQQQQQSSSQQKSQQDKTSESQQQAGSRKNKKGQQQQTAQQPGEPTEATPPTLQEGALRPSLESASAAWGSLPERIRDMLMQGATDRFSKTWEEATENYYRRLAEENSRP